MMSTTRFTGLLALCAMLMACSDRPTSRSIAPPDASFDASAGADPSALRPDQSDLEEVGILAAATGGRASGHVDIPTFSGTFRDNYSFVALSTVPTSTAPFAAKGEFEGGYVSSDGTLAVEIHGDVDCLAITGNQAWVSGPIEKYVRNGLSLPTTGRQFRVRVMDNGEGANDPPDRASFIAEPVNPQSCRFRQPMVMAPNESGNVQVQQK